MTGAAATSQIMLFQLDKPINLVDYAKQCSNANRRQLEPGQYEVEEVDNPTDSGAASVPWLVLVENGKATTCGTAQVNWLEKGRILEEDPDESHR